MINEILLQGFCNLLQLLEIEDGSVVEDGFDDIQIDIRGGDVGVFDSVP